MLGKTLLTGLALWGACLALPMDKEKETSKDAQAPAAVAAAPAAPVAENKAIEVGRPDWRQGFGPRDSSKSSSEHWHLGTDSKSSSSSSSSSSDDHHHHRPCLQCEPHKPCDSSSSSSCSSSSSTSCTTCDSCRSCETCETCRTSEFCRTSCKSSSSSSSSDSSSSSSSSDSSSSSSSDSSSSSSDDHHHHHHRHPCRPDNNNQGRCHNEIKPVGRHLKVNDGWESFYFGPAGTRVAPITFHTFCPGKLRITDYFCSGDRFAVYDNGVFLGNTTHPLFNNCASDTKDPDYAYQHGNWSHGEWKLAAGYHNITMRVLNSPFGMGYGAIRVDTFRDEREPCHLKVCPIRRDDLVVVNTAVPRCQAESVCRALGMHLANIDIQNFLDATTLAFQCSGPFSQSWIDDWNGDHYRGACLVLSTGAAAPGGAINVPNCCTAHLPVICQRKPCSHPPVEHSCSSCHSSCYCRDGTCHRCRDRECVPCKSCESFD